MQEPAPAPPAFAFDEFRLDLDDERLFGPRGPIPLGQKAFRVLRCLVESHGQLVTKARLFDEVWGNVIVSDSALASVIKELRRALGDRAGNDGMIETVYGRGFRFRPAVRPADRGSPGEFARAAVVLEAPAARAGPVPVAPLLANRAAPQPPLIVILPVSGSVGEGPLAHLPAVIEEDVLGALTRQRDLRVLFAPSVDAARAESLASAIETFVLAGAIHQLGDLISLNFRLSRADGLIVWARTERLTPSEIAPVLGQLVRLTVAAILPVIDYELSARFALPLPTDPSALELYLKARQLARNADSLEEARGAADLLEQVIRREPLLVGAYLHLARLYNTDFLHTIAGHDYRKLRERAFVLSRKAVQLDPLNGHASVRLGWCHLRRGEWELARTAFERAIELNPFNADTVNEAGFGFLMLGDIDSAAELIELSVQMNPFPNREYGADLAMLDFFRGDQAGARAHFGLSTERSPFYTAAELANLGFLAAAGEPGAEAELAETAVRFRTRMAAIWSEGTPPSDDEILAWLVSRIPLCCEDQRSLLLSGLALAGFRRAPTGRASSHSSRT